MICSANNFKFFNKTNSSNIIRGSGLGSNRRGLGLDSRNLDLYPRSHILLGKNVEHCTYVLCCREEGDISGLVSGFPPPLCQEPFLYSITDLLGRCTNYSTDNGCLR
jgi:hypothetical protein